VFARRPGMTGDELLAALRARKVLVRHFKAPRIRDFLRITIGTDAQMETVLRVLDEILQ
jgi:histidinol-phosphate aminotransferase